MTKFNLPASQSFVSKFTNFVDKIAGKKKATGKASAGVFQLGSYPALFAPKMKTYEIDDCPWATSALPITDDLASKNLNSMFSKDTMEMSCPEDQVKKLETGLRRSMNILSYLDSFTYGGREKAAAVHNALVDVRGGTECDEEDLNKLVSTSSQSVELLYSSGSAISHLASIIADTIAFLVIWRRDRWMSCLDSSVPPSEKQRLRSLSVNASALFPTEELNLCKQRLTEEKSNKAQDKLIDVSASLSKLITQGKPQKTQEFSTALKPPGQANFKGLNFKKNNQKGGGNKP